MPRKQAPKQAQRPRTADEIALLGKDTDPATAKALRWSYASVKEARIWRGILAFRPRRKWTPAELATLGTMSDDQVARKLGRSKGNVSARRKRLGIPIYKHTTAATTTWTSVQLQLLANNDDARVVQLTGKNLIEVQAKRKALAK